MKVSDIVERLEVVVGLDGSPKRLRLVIEFELTSHFGLPAIQAAEMAERLELPVSRHISALQAKCEQFGTIAVLAVIGSSFDNIAGSCFIQPTDTPAVALLKANRMHADPLWAKMQNLDFAQFERFGAKVLRALGVQKTHVTPQSNDQGIDFYGVLNLGQLQNAPAPFLRLAHDVELRFAGQAKHYPNNPIGTAVIREIVGAVSLARHKTYSSDADLFEELDLKPFSPLLVLVFTTGRLTSGAIDLAEKAGIVARSGRQLAAFLADRGVGMVPWNGPGVIFSDAEFDLWLNAA